MRFHLVAALLALILAGCSESATEKANRLGVEASNLVTQADEETDDKKKLELLQKAQANLNTIVKDLPSSDAAVKIVSGEGFAGVTLADVEAQAAELSLRVQGFPLALPKMRYVAHYTGSDGQQLAELFDGLDPQPYLLGCSPFGSCTKISMINRVLMSRIDSPRETVSIQYAPAVPADGTISMSGPLEFTATPTVDPLPSGATSPSPVKLHVRLKEFRVDPTFGPYAVIELGPEDPNMAGQAFELRASDGVRLTSSSGGNSARLDRIEEISAEVADFIETMVVIGRGDRLVRYVCAARELEAKYPGILTANFKATFDKKYADQAAATADILPNPPMGITVETLIAEVDQLADKCAPAT